MNENVAINVNTISKRFSKNHKSTKKQLLHITKECFLGQKNKPLTEGEFWALKRVSFAVEKNENIAVLGNNGAGKSTLLKMLNGIYLPDEGEIKVRGSVASVLELSTGFDNELSGLENIFLKCAMLGVFKEQAETLVQPIIDFSELGEFIDTPLSHYSSGMKARLGFSVVVHVNPDILILDEVFAVGDKNFKKKSIEAISKLSDQATTIIVSHNMDVVRHMANRVIVMSSGELKFDGSVDKGIEYYNSLS